MSTYTNEKNIFLNFLEKEKKIYWNLNVCRKDEKNIYWIKDQQFSMQLFNSPKLQKIKF